MVTSIVAKFIAFPVVSAAAPRMANASSRRCTSGGTTHPCSGSGVRRSWKMVFRAADLFPAAISASTLAIASLQCYFDVSGNSFNALRVVSHILDSIYLSKWSTHLRTPFRRQRLRHLHDSRPLLKDPHRRTQFLKHSKELLANIKSVK